MLIEAKANPESESLLKVTGEDAQAIRVCIHTAYCLRKNLWDFIWVSRKRAKYAFHS